MLVIFAGKRAVDCHRDANFLFSRLTLNETNPRLLTVSTDRKSVV